jgi:hypothetical protein
MAEINLLFELDDQSVNEPAAQSLQEQIGKLDMVDEVEAVVETPQQVRALTGLEIVAAIGVTVTVLRSGRELLEEVPKVLKAVKAIIKGMKDVKKVYLDVGKRRIPIDDVKPEDLEAVAAPVARSSPASRDARKASAIKGKPPAKKRPA